MKVATTLGCLLGAVAGIQAGLADGQTRGDDVSSRNRLAHNRALPADEVATASNNCCSVHPEPGCDDALCEALVCLFDRFCCENPWDAKCSRVAAVLCPSCAVSLGACCDATTGICSDDVAAPACINLDPADQFTWHKGVSCTAVTCNEHTGACCDQSLPGGFCQNDVPASACTSADPRIQWHKGTECSSVECNGCIVDLDGSYSGGNLTLNLLLGTEVPVNFFLWLIVRDQILPLAVGIPLPVISPPVALPPVVTPIPPLGIIRLVSIMTAAGGIICSDIETIDTGSVLSPIEQLEPKQFSAADPLPSPTRAIPDAPGSGGYDLRDMAAEIQALINRLNAGAEAEKDSLRPLEPKRRRARP